MGEKSVSIKLLSIFILGICLLWNTGSETGIHAGPNNIQKGQAAAKKKSDPVDLSIQSFTLSKSKVQPGEKISMQLRIRLKGKMKTSTYADIYLTSQRHKYSSKNRIFRRTIKSSHFDGAGIVHLQKYHKFPLTQRTGTFYLFLVVDGSNNIKEWDEKNNIAVRTVKIKREIMMQQASRPEFNPDVAVKQLKITPQVVKDGKSFNINFYVTNPGRVHIVQVAYKVWIRKKGGAFATTKHTLHTGLCRNLAPGSKQKVNLSKNIPLNLELPTPPNYLHVHVDPEYKLKEKSSTEHNNFAKVPFTIEITTWPDLGLKRFNANLVGSLQNRLPRGQELKVDLTFKNYGDRKSESCKYKVYIHYWHVRKNLHGTTISAKWERIDQQKYAILPLEPNRSQNSSLRFASGSWETGQYRITVYTDSDGQILESNEDNNKYQRGFKIL